VKITRSTKRAIGVYSPYLFRMRLIYMAYKYGSRVICVNEYLTTKTCSNCGKINEIGDSEEHTCECGMKAGRDENAAKNILKVGMLNDKKSTKKVPVKKIPVKKVPIKKTPNKKLISRKGAETKKKIIEV
jgi:hypothetical protein